MNVKEKKSIRISDEKKTISEFSRLSRPGVRRSRKIVMLLHTLTLPRVGLARKFIGNCRKTYKQLFVRNTQRQIEVGTITSPRGTQHDGVALASSSPIFLCYLVIPNRPLWPICTFYSRGTGAKAIGMTFGPAFGGIFSEPFRLHPTFFSATGIFARCVVEYGTSPAECTGATTLAG